MNMIQMRWNSIFLFILFSKENCETYGPVCKTQAAAERRAWWTPLWALYCSWILQVRGVLLFLWRLIPQALSPSFYTPPILLYGRLPWHANVLPWFQSLRRVAGQRLERFTNQDVSVSTGWGFHHRTKSPIYLLLLSIGICSSFRVDQ